MSKEFNLAGKQLLVDGITILGNRRKARVAQAIANGEAAKGNALTTEQIAALGGTVILISDDLETTKGRVTTNEGDISSQGMRLTTAEGDISNQGTRLTTAEGSITSQGVRITDAEGNIIAQGLRITDAEGNITAQDLRLTDAEGNIVAQGLRLTTAEGDITAQGLRLTTAEGDISAQGLRLTDAEGNIIAQGLRITDAEGKILNLELITKRFDLKSKQTAIIRDDTQMGAQIVVLETTIVGYENPVPRLVIQSGSTLERICAMEADPSSVIDESDIGTSITPTPSGEGSWSRGGQLFSVGSRAAFIQYSGSVFQTVVLTVTAVGDSSITGTVEEIIPAARGIDDRDMTLVSIYIPYRKAGRILATLYNELTLMDTLELPVTDQTRGWRQVVINGSSAVDTVEDLPEIDDDGYLVDGDCMVVRYEYNESTQQYDDFQLNTYIYKNGTWERAEDRDAGQIVETIYTYLGEAADYKIDHPDFNYEDTMSASKAVFGKLMAGILYAGEIFANEILSTRWEGLDPTDGYPVNGFRISTKLNRIDVVDAWFRSAHIKDSSLENVSIDINDGSTNSKLLVSTPGITAPQTDPSFNSESRAYYVESAIRTYKWNNTNLVRHSGSKKKDPTSSMKNASISFEVKNNSYIYFRAPYVNFAKITGSYGTMTSTVKVDGTTVWTETVQEANVASGTYLTITAGKSVEFTVTYNHGDAVGIKGFSYGTKVYILKYLDRISNSWSAEASADSGLSVDAYCIPSTMSIVEDNVSSTDTIYFPVMEYRDLYAASSMGNDFLVDGMAASAKASLQQEGLAASNYRAIQPLLDATGTQGGQTVPAIPRNVWIELNAQQGTVYYKREPFTVNQLYLSETEAVFAYNGTVLFQISNNERSTVNYTVKLDPVDPSLTVGLLIPGRPDTTDIGKSDKKFDSAHIKTVYAYTELKTPAISAPTGQSLTVTGNLVGNVTGDVTGNVNSQGTNNRVYGAVFN